MGEKNLKQDDKFLFRCKKYGLNDPKYEICDDVIVVDTPRSNICILLDENYDTIGFFDQKYEIPLKKVIKRHKEIYGNTVDLPRWFLGLSLQQIANLAGRTSIRETNHGHSLNMTLNGEIVTNSHDNIYVELLSYIVFLKSQIERHYVNFYRAKMKGCYYYNNVYMYVCCWLNDIEESIEKFIKNGERPFPIDIISCLGNDLEDTDEYENSLYGVIDLLLRQHGVKIKGYDGLEAISGKIPDLSVKAQELLKILDVSDEEVAERLGKLAKKQVDLDEWLSNDSSVLTRTKTK